MVTAEHQICCRNEIPESFDWESFDWESCNDVAFVWFTHVYAASFAGDAQLCRCRCKMFALMPVQALFDTCTTLLCQLIAASSRDKHLLTFV